MNIKQFLEINIMILYSYKYIVVSIKSLIMFIYALQIIRLLRFEGLYLTDHVRTLIKKYFAFKSNNIVNKVML